MSEYKDYLTASDYYRFLQCPHWPYYNRHATEEEKGLKRELTQSEINRLEDGLDHEKQVVEELFAGKKVVEVATTKDAEADCASTLQLMRQGAPLIYQGTLTDKDWTGRPDLLRRVEGESELGDWYYEPVDVKSSHNLEKYHRLQLMFYAILLERLQGRFPAHGYILAKDRTEFAVELGDHISEFEEITQELDKIRAGERPDPVLRKNCFDTSPWGAACERLAKSTDDIAQLFNVDVKKLNALRDLGIRTVDDAAEMDIVDLDGKAPGLRLHGLEVAKLQAQSLKNKRVIIRNAVNTPLSDLEIHFDIESDPPNDVDYLYGFLVRDKDKEYYKPFVAKRLEDEGMMWRQFLDWIGTLPLEYTVVHYAPYEKIRLAVLENRYGGSPALDLFRERMIDLKTIVTSSLVIPRYFYGLKYVAKFLGHKWRGEVTGGGQSVDVFEEYLSTGKQKLLDDIILYNEDDVRATAYVLDWCREYAKELTSYDEPYPWSCGFKHRYN
ncbi:MAG: TM0106 family RecB-like putative nuclease [Patescibacteria group bacterium]|nr:TM0106 family RecB-like putative nuclease [Patescibacteria group bacterium]